LPSKTKNKKQNNLCCEGLFCHFLKNNGVTVMLLEEKTIYMHRGVSLSFLFF